MGIALHPFIVFLKNLIFPLLAKCAIVQVKCFFKKKKCKNSNCIISDLLKDISRLGMSCIG